MKPSYLPLSLRIALGGVALLLAGCQSSPPAKLPAAPVATAPAPQPEVKPQPAPPAVYAFGWGELTADLAKPRGGSTRGAPVTLAPGRALPLAEIAAATSAFAKDRAAILSLAGDYKVGFHFMETLGFAAAYQPTRPYHSWATEHVRVVEDTGRFISLQHTLVMFTRNDDGTVSEPMLQKHWRQDWTYEPAELHDFRGNSTWARRTISGSEAAGAWSQSVWQVDDSPRYAALGKWSHDGNRSVWSGENEWRPLPRREHTMRKDYDVMEGAHRIVLTPTGWLHEQLNWKRVAGDGAPGAYVGEEWGLDRYDRIIAPSLSAADDYWKKTGEYWAVVRRAWREFYAHHDHFTIRNDVGGKKLFEEFFAYAEKLEKGQSFDAADANRQVKDILARFVVLVEP